eukprot:scaffold108692_cov18-Tisochrysis_lutea.AAC.3
MGSTEHAWCVLQRLLSCKPASTLCTGLALLDSVPSLNYSQHRRSDALGIPTKHYLTSSLTES